MKKNMLKRRLSKVTLFMVVIVLAFSSTILSGCKKSVANDANTVEVYMFKGGYGTEWLETMAKRFEQLNPDKKIVIGGDSVFGKSDPMIKAGASVTTTDLFFTPDTVHKWVTQGDRLVKGYDVALENLNDVYDFVLENGKTVKEMMNSYTASENAIETLDDSGNVVSTDYYSLSYDKGITGIVYNETELNKVARVPRTSDELMEVCDALKGAGKTPFVSSTSTGYMAYLYSTWYAQYETIDGYIRFCEGKNTDGEYSMDIFKQDGRLYAISAVEEILNPNNGRIHDNVNSYNFAAAQTQLLLGNAIMMVNGDWFENEMKKVNGQNWDFTLKNMKTPILSDIIHKTKSITSDTILREVISFIDGETTQAPSGVTDADIKIIREARQVVYSLSANNSAYIPAYATAKNTAKDFLKFMASEEASKIYFDSTSGGSMTFDYPLSDDRLANLSEFQKTKNEITKDATFVPNMYRFPLYYNGGLAQWSGNRSNIEVSLATKNDAERKSGLQMYNDEIAAHTDSSFNSMLRRAGLI